MCTACSSRWFSACCRCSSRCEASLFRFSSWRFGPGRDKPSSLKSCSKTTVSSVNGHDFQWRGKLTRDRYSRIRPVTCAKGHSQVNDHFRATKPLRTSISVVF